MDRDARALQLIGQTYHAAIGELAWKDFAAEMCEAYEGALVCLCLGAPWDPGSIQLHAAGLPEDFGPSLWRAWVERLPWESSHLTEFSEGFASASRAFPALRIEDSDFFRHWMEPRGLPPVWPICVSVATRPMYPEAAVVILRQPEAGARGEFSEQDLQLASLLLPHLRRGLAIHAEMSGIEWNRRALHDIVERLRLGVILLDVERRLLRSNRSADRTLAAEGGLRLRAGKLHALRADDDRKLQGAIGRALENVAMRRFHLDENIYFAREAEEPHLDLLVKPLLSGAPGGASSDAVVAVLIADLREVYTFSAQAVRSLYSLTPAEAELVQLLVGGASLNQAAERRGVTLTTARSQLKRIFAKTGTKRQGELVQRVLVGLTAVWEAEDEVDREARRLPSSELTPK